MYTKHTWQTEELITAEKLNNLEEGVSSVIPTTTGYLSDGDIFTVQSSDGSVKKMVWREIEVPLTLVEDRTPSSENMSDIDSSVDVESLFNLLDSKAEALYINKISFESTTTMTGWVSFPAQKTLTGESESFIFANDSLSIVIGIEKGTTYVKQYIYNPSSSEASGTIEHYLLVHGFLPAEE